MKNAKLLLVATLLAAASGLGLWSYLKRFEAETSGGPRTPVLMATRDIPLGHVLQEDMLGFRQVPQAYLEPRQISAEELPAVLGARLNLAVRAGESVLWSDLANMQGERRDLSGLIEPGMRALTVAASAESLFGGLLRPGDRVDVLYTPDLGNASKPATVTLLQSVLVLAVGTDTGAPGGSAALGSVVTVSLTPEQAQVVVHARTRGSLDVALRHPDDTLVLDGLPASQAEALEQAEARARLSRRVPRSRSVDHVR